MKNTESEIVPLFNQLIEELKGIRSNLSGFENLNEMAKALGSIKTSFDEMKNNKELTQAMASKMMVENNTRHQPKTSQNKSKTVKVDDGQIELDFNKFLAAKKPG